MSSQRKNLEIKDSIVGVYFQKYPKKIENMFYSGLQFLGRLTHYFLNKRLFFIDASFNPAKMQFPFSVLMTVAMLRLQSSDRISSIIKGKVIISIFTHPSATVKSIGSSQSLMQGEQQQSPQQVSGAEQHLYCHLKEIETSK